MTVEPAATAAVQFHLAKQQRVAAPDEYQVHNQKLACITQAKELLCEAHRAWHVVSQCHGRQRYEGRLDLDKGGRDGVVSHQCHGIDIRHIVAGVECRAAAIPGGIDSVKLLECTLQRAYQLGTGERDHAIQKPGWCSIRRRIKGSCR